MLPDHFESLAHVELEEVSGSETLVHAGHAGLALAAQLEGVHRHPSGAPVTLFIPPSRLFAFTPGGPLVAAPPFAQEAAHGPH